LQSRIVAESILVRDGFSAGALSPTLSNGAVSSARLSRAKIAFSDM